MPVAHGPCPVPSSSPSIHIAALMLSLDLFPPVLLLPCLEPDIRLPAGISSRLSAGLGANLTDLRLRLAARARRISAYILHTYSLRQGAFV
jgi:hypothetical protein